MSIEDKIQSVKTGSAATNPYAPYSIMMNEIIMVAEGITLVNNGNTVAPNPPPVELSDFEKIENEWNGYSTVDPITGDITVFPGWLTAIETIRNDIANIMIAANAHYDSFWNHTNLNYKNRPALLNGVHQIRMNVAIQDAGGDTLSDLEKETIANNQHNDLTNGSISFQPSSQDEIRDIVDNAILKVSTIGNPVVAALPIDVIQARDELLLVRNDLVTISNKLNIWYGTETNQHIDSLAYATAYGAVMFAEQKAGDPVVESLMGNLP